MSPTIVTDSYSDQDMQCPASWENGFKQGRVERFGDGERALSDRFTGEWRGSSFRLKVSDFDRRFRQQLNSPVDRYWNPPLTIRMTTRENRALLGIPYTVFVGPIVDAQPVPPLSWDITLGDIVSQGLLADKNQIPWRIIRDGFLNELDEVHESLDLDTPEPIIYGQHLRQPDDDPASAQGFLYPPTLLGKETIEAVQYWVWLVAGHTCKDIPDVFVDDVSVIGDEGTSWLVPHHAGWTGIFTDPYVDRRSATYGNDRRYTLIYGKVGDTDPDACAAGEAVLTVQIDGIEDEGDGSGDLITDRLDQYRHFAINFIANFGQRSYQSGLWLANPTWDVFGETISIIDESSFEACRVIAEGRLPSDGASPPSVAGYIGAAIIGARAGDRSSVLRWIAAWNRSCATQHGITNVGQYKVVMLHPTDAIKEAAPLYTDAYEILQGSFQTDVGWTSLRNRVPFRADYEHTSGQWKTSDVAEAGDSIAGYERDIDGDIREYPFAPGITAAYHLARLEVLITRHPPRHIVFEATVGPDSQNLSLGYLDLGDYIRYVHFAEVGDASEIRLAQIVRHQVQAGRRRVLVEAIDCEDYIDYDAAPEFEPDLGNSTCDTAIEIGEPFAYATTIDTTAHPTDTSVEGVMPGPGIAYHAAWWKITPPADGSLLISTVHSLYDTQMAVLTGTCGSSPIDWTLLHYNDNDGLLQTSILEFDVTMGTEYYILVAGYGPDDGGSLTFGATFNEPEL